MMQQNSTDGMKFSLAADKAMAALRALVDRSGLDVTLRDLIKVRASQINGSAYCIAMHTRDARRIGESDERMHLLNAWKDAPIYSARERAALAWTEAIARIPAKRVPDGLYDQVRQQFSETELVDLTGAVVAINTWNRIAVAFRAPPQPEAPDAPA